MYGTPRLNPDGTVHDVSLPSRLSKASIDALAAGGGGGGSYTDTQARAVVAASLGLSTTVEDTVPRKMVNVACQTVSGRLTLTYFTALATATRSSVTIVPTLAAAATPTLARVGLYLVNGDDTLTLVASTANDTNLFNVANTAFTRTFSASYGLTAGVRYALGILVVTAATVPQFAGSGPSVASSALGLLTPREAGYLNGQTDLPATVAAALTGGTNAFWARLS